jgi:hypothetical protein
VGGGEADAARAPSNISRGFHLAYAPNISAEPPQAAKAGSDHVDGRVLRRVGKGGQPVPGTWVTLHRVGSDTAGPLDSTRTKADGRYAFTYKRTGDPQAIYFVSSTFDGVAYFSQPLRAAVETGDDAQITVFDTTSHALALTLRGRHLIIAGPGQDGLRTIVEVFEVSNDSSMTLVAGGSNADRPTWTTLLPTGATRFRVGQGDIAADAVSATNGRVDVFAPFAPGVKQFSFSFALPQSAFPLMLPLEHPTGMIEALTEEPAATVRSPALAPTAAVTVQGQTFQRFVGENTPANGALRVDVPAPPVSGQPIYMAALIAVVGGALLLGLARAFTRPVPRAVVPEGERERLAREIAELDDAFARSASPSQRARATYTTKRDALKAELTNALAAAPRGHSV